MTAPARPLAVASSDPEVLAAVREAAKLASDSVASLQEFSSMEELEAASDFEGQLVLDPALLAPESVHEWTLSFLRQARALVWVLTRGDLADADGLARFVGAQGALTIPLDAPALAERLASPFGAPSLRPQALKPDETGLALGLDAILSGREPSEREAFVAGITVSDTGLFSPDYWRHRLDEEFKRSNRFRFPLGLVSLSFDGEVHADALMEIAGVILLDTRDVDIVAQFDPRTFVALLPHTGQAGTKLFAERVHAALAKCSLRDLLDEPLEWESSVVLAPDQSVPTSSAFLAMVLPDQPDTAV